MFITFSTSLYIIINGSLGYFIKIRIVGLLTFSENVIAALHGYNPMPFIAHLWTITFEEQFYIFIPAIILLLVRSSYKNKLISFISIIFLLNIIRVILIANNAPYPTLWVLPITRFDSIILGIVMGFGGLDFLLKKVKPIFLFLLGIFFFFLLSLFSNLEQWSYWLIPTYLFVGISTTLILFSVLNSRYLKKIFALKPFVFLGKRSYGLYVYHLLGNGVAAYLITKVTILPAGALASFTYSLAFTIIVSILSYRLIEKPFLKLKKRYEVIFSRPI